MGSRYEELVPNVLKTDEVKSTNQIRQEVAKLAGVKYIEFNLVYRILEQLEKNGKAEKLKGPKKSYYWKKK